MDLPRKENLMVLTLYRVRLTRLLVGLGCWINYCNVNLPSSIATPVEVVSSVLGFNKEMCTLKANQMLGDYNNMMNNILMV